jgi:hypothetical protein
VTYAVARSLTVELENRALSTHLKGQRRGSIGRLGPKRRSALWSVSQRGRQYIPNRGREKTPYIYMGFRGLTTRLINRSFFETGGGQRGKGLEMSLADLAFPSRESASRVPEDGSGTLRQTSAGPMRIRSAGYETGPWSGPCSSRSPASQRSSAWTRRTSIPIRRRWLRLHEKGGKLHEVPVHHELDDYLHEYLAAAGIGDGSKAPLFRSLNRRRLLTERRPRDDQAAGPGRRPSRRLLPHIPSNWDHRLPEQRRYA